MRRLAVGLGVLLLVGVGLGVAAAQDDEQYAAVEFLVLRDYNGKPVKNASVIMHPVKRNGKQKNSGLQLKTNTEGKTSFDGVPYGPLRIQVLADGFQTFGEDYTIDKAEMAITVKLKRPQGQYSVYEDHPENKTPENKTEEKKNDAAPPPAKPEQKPQ
ncbi:MAG TPA: carboxypeptidase-like regulatory domain-containing protein [Terriglobales bacterium]|jgi:hypothetical protein|nr:carboxypeptidase-like regulatory domain-containing protein [Terriglobales bacterium]